MSGAYVKTVLRVNKTMSIIGNNVKRNLFA